MAPFRRNRFATDSSSRFSRKTNTKTLISSSSRFPQVHQILRPGFTKARFQSRALRSRRFSSSTLSGGSVNTLRATRYVPLCSPESSSSSARSVPSGRGRCTTKCRGRRDPISFSLHLAVIANSALWAACSLCVALLLARLRMRSEEPWPAAPRFARANRRASLSCPSAHDPPRDHAEHIPRLGACALWLHRSDRWIPNQQRSCSGVEAGSCRCSAPAGAGRGIVRGVLRIRASGRPELRWWRRKQSSRRAEERAARVSP